MREQERALMRGIAICLLAFAAGMGLWVYNYAYGHRPSRLPPAPPAIPAAAKPLALVAPVPAPAPPPPVIATIPGPRFVHRGGSVLRDRPKASGKTLKKEAKGAKVTLEALEDDGWARVTDGNIHGYMRASVLGVAPPEAD